MQVQLQTSFIREGNRFIVYAPALDISTSGKTLAQAKKRFSELVEIFFDELHRHGTLREALTELGWQEVNERWTPPAIIGQESHTVKIRARA